MECAEVAENFEYAIAKVQSIARVSGDTLESMSSDIRRVGVEMGYYANEIAEATYQAKVMQRNRYTNIVGYPISYRPS